MNETLTNHDTEPTLSTRMNGMLAIHEIEKAKDNAKGMDAPRKNWWLPLLGILLVAAIVACWPVFHPLAKALTCGLGLTLAVAAVYWLVRPRKKLDDALKESHYEKFQRLVGFYLTIPETVRNQPENAAAARSFETQWKELEKHIDPKTRKFQRDDADHLVHNLHLALLQVATIDYLHFNLQALETEYRQAAGPTAYEAYLKASTPKPTDPPVSPDERDRLLRSEATYLVNETRRQQQLRQHVQSTRQSLLKAAFRSWWMNAIPLLAMVLVFLACMSGVKTAMEPRSSKTGDWTVELARQYLIVDATANQGTRPYTPLFKALIIMTLLALAGIAGATGGMMSVIQRVQTDTPESDAITNLWALSQAETAVFFAPVTGLIFALVLSLFFAGGVLSGSVFPDFSDPQYQSEWFRVLFDGKALAVWLLWAFVAGFCERMVPDALDTLAKQQADNNAKATPGAGARNLPAQNQPQTAVAGAKNDFKPSGGAPSNESAGSDSGAPLTGKAPLSAMAKNPGSNGGDSNVAQVNVSPVGG
jgi:hypothetical protein